MSWASDTKWRLHFFAIFLTFLCPGFLIWLAPQTSRQIASLGWPAVIGKVDGVTAKTWIDSDNHLKYFGRVKYRYEVDGKKYATDMTDLGPGTKRSSREEALADVAEFSPGQIVQVYYDPADAEIGIIRKGIPPVHLVLLIGLIIGSIVGGVVTFFSIRGWIRSRQTKKEEVAAPISSITPSDLGPRLELFKPTHGNIIAGFIISLLLVAGGAAAIVFPLRGAYLADWNLPFDVKKGWSWLAVGLWCIIGVALFVGGLFLAAFSKRLISHCVEICANGLHCYSRSATDVILWKEISVIRETICYERPPLLKGPAKFLLPKIASSSFTMVTRAGKELGFNGTSIGKIKRFALLLKEQASQHAIPWETLEEHA
jgi:hypothetical protein